MFRKTCELKLFQCFVLNFEGCEDTWIKLAYVKLIIRYHQAINLKTIKTSPIPLYNLFYLNQIPLMNVTGKQTVGFFTVFKFTAC